MGIIGKDLLDRLERAEREDDWDMTIALLAMAQVEATKNYVQRVREAAKGGTDEPQ